AIKCSAGNWPAPMPDHRDSSETFAQPTLFSVNRCGQGARCADDAAVNRLLVRTLRIPAQGRGVEAVALHRSNPVSGGKALVDASARDPRCWIAPAAPSAPSRAAVR